MQVSTVLRECAFIMLTVNPYPKNTNSQVFRMQVSTVLRECAFIMLTVNLIMKTTYISLKRQF